MKNKKGNESTNIEMIAFDADDTLWYAEKYYIQAQEELHKLLDQYAGYETIEALMLETEARNVPVYGYGIKGFVISMIEVAIHVSDSSVNGETIRKILDIGRNMLAEEVSLFEGVPETLNAISDQYRMMVITKGDYHDQMSKVARSGLAHLFEIIEVVHEKTTATYARILEKYRLDPSRFIMVGNSLRSDILPVLELGGTTIHIPAETTWALETVPDFDDTSAGYYPITRFSQLPGLLSDIH